MVDFTLNNNAFLSTQETKADGNFDNFFSSNRYKFKTAVTISDTNAIPRFFWSIAPFVSLLLSVRKRLAGQL